ncbi:MAG: 2'-5' RNA ligase family protein [Elainella sp. Prado103]|jgi:2'-5' RNA ligase|nr:2'-5' RNA ligase family protein [Elainella sp. Prado103]
MAQESVKARFFIALLPPEPIQSIAARLIQDLSQRYHTRTAKAPPHITLQPPFGWAPTALPDLTDYLTSFANNHPAIPIELAGFGAFAPRVLYIHVAQTTQLMHQQAALMHGLEEHFGICDPHAQQRSFTPHLTLASRHLTPQSFRQAWEDLQSQSLKANFVVNQLTLLRYEQHWQVQSEFQLQP